MKIIENYFFEIILSLLILTLLIFGIFVTLFFTSAGILCFGTFKDIFENKETLWVAVTGMITSLGLILGLVFSVSEKRRDNSQLKANLKQALVLELNINLARSSNNALETKLEVNTYTSLISNPKITHSSNAFNRLNKVYGLFEYYNNLVTAQKPNDILVQVSAQVAAEILEMINITSAGQILKNIKDIDLNEYYETAFYSLDKSTSPTDKPTSEIQNEIASKIKRDFSEIYPFKENAILDTLEKRIIRNKKLSESELASLICDIKTWLYSALKDYIDSKYVKNNFENQKLVRKLRGLIIQIMLD